MRARILCLLPEAGRGLHDMSEEIKPVLFFEGLGDESQQFRDVERFEQVAGSAMPYPFHGGF